MSNCWKFWLLHSHPRGIVMVYEEVVRILCRHPFVVTISFVPGVDALLYDTRLLLDGSCVAHE